MGLGVFGFVLVNIFMNDLEIFVLIVLNLWIVRKNLGKKKVFFFVLVGQIVG